MVVETVKMPTQVKETLQKQKPIPIATASKDGTPNVVFIGSLKIVDDETLLITDNFFYKTAKNLEENPKISVLCYDSETKRSFQIKGSVKVHKGDKVHEELRAQVHAVNPKNPVKAAVVVKIEAIFDSLWGPTAGTKIA